jgi:hypothetical protein
MDHIGLLKESKASQGDKGTCRRVASGSSQYPEARKNEER